jgi:dTDP-4-amino-4,6-dideoxygalactose transaminase
LEEEVAKITQIEKVVCLNSWTSGTILVLKWFGDKVIVPAHKYSATSLAVLHCGVKPVMVDIGKDFTTNTENIEKAITSKTKIIVPADLAGWPCDYDAIKAIVNKEQIVSLLQPESDKQK